jgi:hypothetical protein
MEGVRMARLRWRLRGAWQWPLFCLLVPVDGVLLQRLPVSGDGPGGIFPAVLLAGFLNLVVVAALAPLAGWLVRRRRPDLPRAVATDYAGAVLICALAAGLLAAGLVHRPMVTAERQDRLAQFGAVHDYIVSQAPEYRAGLGAADAVRLKEDLYRTCVPGPIADRPLCMFVETDQRPAGVTRDPDRTPNSEYRRGGF